VKQVDFVDKKAKVTKKVATGLYLSLAAAHLYRDEYTECASAISQARGMGLGDASAIDACDDLLNRLLKRRRASIANPDFVLPSEDEVAREKAPDFKSAIGKRSQNNDVAMILGGDRYLEMGDILARWKSEFVAGSAEASASEAAEMTMEQRLGAKLSTTIGGVSLSLNPLTDPDLVGQPLPVEVLSIPKLVYLDLSGMKIGALPANIDELSMLQTLIVSGNELNELPATLANIPTLKRVVARNNNLTSLPAGMENIPELKSIDLKGNPFDDGAKVQTIRRFGEDVKIKVD
jgi:Leucine-rich repeat (LRR) protein